jgi:hypothetical protein
MEIDSWSARERVLQMKKLTENISAILLSRRIFVAFAVVFVLYNVIGMLLLYERSSDYWGHLASIYAFAENPINPPNPYILSDKPTHLFTPYHLFWGVVARILHVHPFWLLPVVAGVNMLLFIAGVRVFSRKILHDEKYALILALTMLFFWNDSWPWSGVYAFGLLPLTAVYPCWFALSVSLLIIAVYGESANRFFVVFYSLVVCCIFLCHPLVGSFLLLSLVAKVLTMQSISIFKRIELLAVPLLCVAFSALFWPYFSVADTIFRSGSFVKLGVMTGWRTFYENPVWRILPALFGLPFLAYSLFKRRLTFAAFGLTAAAGIYLFNYFILQNALLARYVIYVAFYGQVGVIQSLQCAEKHMFYKYAVFGYLIMLALFAPLQIVSSARYIGPLRDIVLGTPIGTHTNITIFHQYLVLKQYIERSDVVLAPLETSERLPGVIQCRVVGCDQATPFVPDYFERQLAVEMFFARDSMTADRLRVLSEYSVKYVLVPRDYESAVNDFTPYLTLVYKDDGYALYAVR